MTYTVARRRTPNVIVSCATYPHPDRELLAMLWDLASDTLRGFPSPYVVWID